MVPCVLIRCEIEEMERDASVIIQVRARVNVAAVTQVSLFWSRDSFRQSQIKQNVTYRYYVNVAAVTEVSVTY